MLDLKKLEKKLDKALAKETKESLTNWLMEKRNKVAFDYLGEGAMEDLCLSYSESVTISTTRVFKNAWRTQVASSNHSSLANAA